MNAVNIPKEIKYQTKNKYIFLSFSLPLPLKLINYIELKLN